MGLLSLAILLSCSSLVTSSECDGKNCFNWADETQIRIQLTNALKTVQQILNTTRHLEAPLDAVHSYEDKYGLAEFLTNSAIAAQLNALAAIGAHLKNFPQNDRSISIGFRGQQSCAYLRNETKLLPLNKGKGANRQTFETAVSHIYLRSLEWQFVAFRGVSKAFFATNDPSMWLLDARNVSFEISSASSEMNVQECLEWTSPTFRSPDLDVTWLLQNLDSERRPNFKIKRDEDCYTPRRNTEVDKAVIFFFRVEDWAYRVRYSIPGWLEDRLADTPIFVPIVPLFEPRNECDARNDTCTRRVVLSTSDLNAFLSEQQASLHLVAQTARRELPARSHNMQHSEVEALISAVLYHQRIIARAYVEGINSIEDMLRQQLRQAIGKDISPPDFGNLIHFNNQRLFRPLFKPQALSRSVRRPDHDPEGFVEIQQVSTSTPISSWVRSFSSHEALNVTLSGGTVINLNASRSLHATMLYLFDDQKPNQFTLSARARQFSSFVLLVGTLVSINEFRPDIGIIIKDNDDLALPLLLTALPSPQAFRDAIESLSPEQQNFAKAFRSMQLSSTLFAFAVVQIKPQLEKLLKLPEDSLTKEIQLTQDLMRLFLDYQIPPDLLSFQGTASDDHAKLDFVKLQVAKIDSFIESEKQLQIKAKQEADLIRLKAQQEAERLAALQQQAAEDAARMRAQIEASVLVKYRSRVPQMMPISRAVAGPIIPESYEREISVGSQFVPISMAKTISNSGLKTSDTTRANSAYQTIRQPDTSSPVEVHPQRSVPVPPQDQDASVDMTAIPVNLDKRMLELDKSGSLRATTIKPGPLWQLHSQQGLLGSRVFSEVAIPDQVIARQKAFDLLESISNAGILSFDQAEFHVVIAATQSFEETLLNTVIQKNQNPLSQFEQSSLIVASTIFDRPAADLLVAGQASRLAALS